MTQTLSKTPINTPRVTPIINPTPILLSSTTPNNPTGTSFNNTSSSSHSNPGNMYNNPQPQNIVPRRPQMAHPATPLAYSV